MKLHNRWAASALITVALGVLSVVGSGAHAAPLPVIKHTHYKNELI